jgi:hypothetical protein
MVEYAILLAQNTTDIVSMTGRDVVSWVSGLNWARIGIGALGLISLRMAVRAFTGR